MQPDHAAAGRWPGFNFNSFSHRRIIGAKSGLDELCAFY
jgi:hypothetical protein